MNQDTLKSLDTELRSAAERYVSFVTTNSCTLDLTEARQLLSDLVSLRLHLTQSITCLALQSLPVTSRLINEARSYSTCHPWGWSLSKLSAVIGSMKSKVKAKLALSPSSPAVERTKRS